MGTKGGDGVRWSVDQNTHRAALKSANGTNGLVKPTVHASTSWDEHDNIVIPGSYGHITQPTITRVPHWWPETPTKHKFNNPHNHNSATHPPYPAHTFTTITGLIPLRNHHIHRAPTHHQKPMHSKSQTHMPHYQPTTIPI